VLYQGSDIKNNYAVPKLKISAASITKQYITNQENKEKGQEKRTQTIILVHPSSRAISSLFCNFSKKNSTKHTQLYIITSKNPSCTLKGYKTH